MSNPTATLTSLWIEGLWYPFIHVFVFRLCFSVKWAVGCVFLYSSEVYISRTPVLVKVGHCFLSITFTALSLKETTFVYSLWACRVLWRHAFLYPKKLTIQFTSEGCWIFKSLVGQPSPVKSNPSTPVKGVVSRDTSMVQEEFLKFYKESGLDSLAREVRVIDITSWRSTYIFTICDCTSFALDEQYKAYLNLSAVVCNIAIHNSW